MVEAFLDTDVILNVLCEEADQASNQLLWVASKEILNLTSSGFVRGRTSIVNLMEIRSVLSKKKSWKKETIFRKEELLKGSLDIIIPTWTDFIRADKLQKETFLYPMDCLILTLAGGSGSVLLSRDAELLSQTAVPSLTPENFLKKYFPDVFERIKDSIQPE